MFPLRDENARFLTPFGNYLLLGLNLAVWLVVQGLGSEARRTTAGILRPVTCSRRFGPSAVATRTTLSARAAAVEMSDRSLLPHAGDPAGSDGFVL